MAPLVDTGCEARWAYGLTQQMAILRCNEVYSQLMAYSGSKSQEHCFLET